MKNKLLRLAELIQEDFPEDLVDAFKSAGNQSLAMRLKLVNQARNLHQSRSERLWLQAGKKRTPAERRAVAQAEIASFVSAYLTGDAREHAETAVEALRALDRHGETELVTSLCRS